ncbi:MAG: response regulator [Phormidium sp. SL48-SHIP]|nr:MAG: response regulator [Phormidium sp. SL48-SHIP]
MTLPLLRDPLLMDYLQPQKIWQRWRQRHQSGWRPRNLLVYGLFGTLAVGVSLTAWISYRLVRELLLTNISQGAISEVREGGQELEDWFQTQTFYLEGLANNPTIASGDWEQIQPYLAREVERLDNFISLAIANREGEFRNHQQQTGQVDDRQHFQTAMEEGRISFSNPIIGRAIGEPLIGFTLPLATDPDAPQPSAASALIGGISIDQFVLTLNQIQYGDDSYALAFDSNNQPVASPGFQNQLPESLKLQSPDISQDFASLLLPDLNPDILQKGTLNGEAIYFAYHPIQAPNWTVVLVIPQENIEKQLESLNLLAGVLSVILALATILAGRQINDAEQSRARAEREALLNGLTSRLHTSLDLDKTLPPTLEELTDLLVFDAIAFAWYDRRQQSLTLADRHPQNSQLFADSTHLEAAESQKDLDSQLRNGETVTLIRHPQAESITLHRGHYSAFPVINRLGTPGYLLCHHGLPIPINNNEEEFMRRVVAQLSIALTQAHLHAESQRAVISLEREQQQLRQVVTNAPVAMAMFDSQMRFLAFSEKWVSDYQLQDQDLLGECLYDVLQDLPGDRHQAHQEALGGQVITEPELVWQRQDGDLLYLRSAIHPWYKSEGEIGGIIAVTDRIDDLVKARLEAERAAQFKAEFLANMSHEIRTPMNGVMGMTSLLSRTQLTRQQRDYVSTISRSAQHLLTLINDILDFSKLEAGEMELDAIDFDLDRCIEDIVDVMATQVEDKVSLELATLIDPDVPRHLRGDPARLRQVLLNLVSNAIKFTERGEVVIQAALESEQHNSATIRFAVRDTGMGIPKSAQTKLFQSFSQVDASTTRQYGGTGLGLAISQQLVHLMEGKIGVESVEGIGSIFWFTVPLELADSTPSSALPQMPLNISRLRLLVAAENATTRQSVRYLVQSWGISQITEVGTGSNALETLKESAERSHPYNVLILDLQLSDIDRDKFLAEIRAYPLLRTTKIVVMSNFKDRASAETFLEEGAAASYFLKPVRASRLFDALITAVAPQLHLERDPDSDTEFFDPDLPLPSKRFSHIKLLVVEDHPTNQQVIMSQLQELGAVQIDCASNGQEALNLCRQTHYDLVLMDCQMPILDGYEATQELRRREADSDRHTIIIALTAHAMPTDREQCLEAGMDDYIPKPVDWDVLLETLERWTTHPATEGDRSSNPTKFATMSHNSADLNRPSRSSSQTRAPLPPSSSDSSGNPPISNHDSDESNPCLEPSQMSQDSPKPQIPLDLERLVRVSRGKVSLQKRLLQAFVDATQTDLENLRAIVDDQDGDRITEIAHRLKGAAANVGATVMSEQSADLEQAAKEQNFEQVESYLQRLLEQWQQIKQFLETLELS